MCQARRGLLHVTRYTAIYEVDVDGGQLVRLGAFDASRMDPECAPAYEAGALTARARVPGLPSFALSETMDFPPVPSPPDRRVPYGNPSLSLPRSGFHWRLVIRASSPRDR